MPMKLRDGKIYKSRPTSRMLLRDGKIINTDQPRFVDKSGALDEGRYPYSVAGTSAAQGGYALKCRDRSGAEPRNYIGGAKRKANGGLNMAGNNNAMESERLTRRYVTTNQGVTSETVERSLQFKVVSSNGKVLRMASTPKTTSRKGADTSRGSRWHAQDNGTGRTSTPITHGAPVSCKADHESDFVISDSGEQLIDFDQSFTKISKKQTNENNFETPANRRLISKERHENLEDSIFEDLSKPIIYHNISEDTSDVESMSDITDSPCANLSSYPYYGNCTNESVNLDHAKWSKFHHRRREWYLNRLNTSGREKRCVGWRLRIYTTIFSIITTVHLFLSTKISYLLSVFDYSAVQNEAKRRKRKNVSTGHYSARAAPHSTSVLKKRDANFCYYICAPVCLGIIAFVLISFLLYSHNGLSDGANFYNLTEHGMKNAYYLTFGEESNSFPAWHVYPIGEARRFFGTSYPVTFYIRNVDNQDGKRRLEIFKVLSSAGYSVIIPVFPEVNLIGGWKAVRKLFNESSVFLWGEEGTARDMQEVAKEFCNEGFPPSGVVIETKGEVDKERKIKEFELWSCNCTAVRTGSGVPYPYTHVKCPVDIDNLNSDVIYCLQALRK